MPEVMMKTIGRRRRLTVILPLTLLDGGLPGYAIYDYRQFLGKLDFGNENITLILS